MICHLFSDWVILSIHKLKSGKISWWFLTTGSPQAAESTWFWSSISLKQLCSFLWCFTQEKTLVFSQNHFFQATWFRLHNMASMTNTWGNSLLEWDFFFYRKHITFQNTLRTQVKSHTQKRADVTFLNFSYTSVTG